MRLVRTWTLVLCAIGLLVIAATARDYGINWDDGVQARYGEAVVEDLATDIFDDLTADGTLDSFTLVDARTADVYADGHIPGALHVLYDDLLAEGADAIPAPLDRRVVFYCYGGT